MFNKDKFRAKIIESGMTTSQVANALGVSESTLYRKMNGKSDFSRSEIQILRAELKMNTNEAERVFFAKELA